MDVRSQGVPTPNGDARQRSVMMHYPPLLVPELVPAFMQLSRQSAEAGQNYEGPVTSRNDRKQRGKRKRAGPQTGALTELRYAPKPIPGLFWIYTVRLSKQAITGRERSIRWPD
jgi:hypothetical protein